MNSKIDKTVEKFNMLSFGDKVLVGCSGGADSMLLLNYLLSVKEKLNLTVEVAHIEHGIRGKESVEDAEFVSRFCKDHGVKFHLLTIDAIREGKALGVGVEEYSRKRRYEFFNSIECDKIATAHNLNDNIETVLFRLARGTGIKGVCGIPAVRGKIIRPLIELGSGEIRFICRENNIKYRVDSTNSDTKYSRNFIRSNIIPQMQILNSDFLQNMSLFISSVNEDNDFINSYSDSAYDLVYTDEKLCIEKLNNYPVSVKKRIIIKYFDKFGLTLDSNHLNSVLDLCFKISRVQIKKNHFAVSNGEFIRYVNYDEIDSENNFSFVTQILKKSEFTNKNVDFYCDYDKIIGSVLVRNRIQGDKIKPYKRGCTKTLKKLFNELKIPEESRCGVGVVADDNGVIGIIGYCVDERVAVTSDTQNILSLRLLSEDNDE